jgi:hypothetical protein
MPVPDTIQQLRAARASHKAWVARAEALVNGLPLDKNQVPVEPTECAFGQWLYGAGRRLKDFSVFAQIEASHSALHRVYAEIFKLLFDEPKGIGKLFGQSKKATKAKHLEAEMLLPRLRMHYDEIMRLLNTLENDYLAMKEEVKTKPKSPMEALQTKSFRDVSKMMEDLEKDVDSWLK